MHHAENLAPRFPAGQAIIMHGDFDSAPPPAWPALFSDPWLRQLAAIDPVLGGNPALQEPRIT